jgi:hypothetical protein
MEQSSSQKSTPALAPPGAGIPFPQKLFLRVYVRPFVAARSSIEDSKNTFEKITDKILREIADLTDDDLKQKVLVPPQKGLEDSSRYWSIAMALEHLGIVGRKIFSVIDALSHNQTINEKADTAKVKPLGHMSTQESLNDFKAFALSEFLKVQVPNPDSKNKFQHPWFGPMNSREWYWLLGAHQAIHLQQIRAIRKELKRGLR